MTVTTAQLAWEPLPNATRNRTPEERPIASAIKARPNEWARVFVMDSQAQAGNVAQQINNGKRAAFRCSAGGHFESRSRTIDGEFRVYVKYVPAAS